MRTADDPQFGVSIELQDFAGYVEGGGTFTNVLPGWMYPIQSEARCSVPKVSIARMDIAKSGEWCIREHGLEKTI